MHVVRHVVGVPQLMIRFMCCVSVRYMWTSATSKHYGLSEIKEVGALGTLYRDLFLLLNGTKIAEVSDTTDVRITGSVP